MQTVRPFKFWLLLISASASCGVARAATTLTLTPSLDGNTLHVEASASDAAALANTQLLIDTDASAKTGYAGAGPGHGYDLMVEGTTVYTFKGKDQAAWSWVQAGQATRNLHGASMTLEMPSKDIPATSVVTLRSLSKDYGTVLASSPAVSLGTSAGEMAQAAQPAAPAADAPVAPGSDLSAKVSQEGADLKLVVTTKTAADFNTVLIFFDTDCNADTGFQPPADPHFGFEYMVQGGALSKHGGDARGGWSWENVAAVKQTTDGNVATVTFNASLLKTTKLKVGLWQMSPDWQTRTAAFPLDSASAATTSEVSLDAAKLHADATMQEFAPAPAHANAGESASARFHTAKTYSCYYGAGKYNELSHNDVAILHIPAQTRDSVVALNKLGVVTIGYISVGEDESCRVGNGNGPGGKASWYFHRKAPNAPDENGVWGSYYANANDPEWRADRVAQARHLIGTGPDDLGFAGIFLDTVETSDAYPESRPGMIQLIEQLRAALPKAVIVMNRGFSLLKEDRVSKNIDGVMYEDFTDSYDFATKTYFRYLPQDLDSTRVVMESSVEPAMQKYGLKVLALDYCPIDRTDLIQEAIDRAYTFGMLPGASTISLDAVYPIWTYTPRRDEKFLKPLATPETMRFVLPMARNGFPAGTVLQPSSCYMGYSVSTLVDGIADRGALAWNKAAWASAETPGAAQSLRIDFPQPVQTKTLTIRFATDNSKTFVSKNIMVSTAAGKDGPWTPAVSGTGGRSDTVEVTLPAAMIGSIKLEQAPGGGDPGRPDILWLAQLSLAT